MAAYPTSVVVRKGEVFEWPAFLPETQTMLHSTAVLVDWQVDPAVGDLVSCNQLLAASRRSDFLLPPWINVIKQVDMFRVARRRFVERGDVLRLYIELEPESLRFQSQEK